MNDQHRPLPTVSPEALLRYSVLAQVEALVLSGCRRVMRCARSPRDSMRTPTVALCR